MTTFNAQLESMSKKRKYGTGGIRKRGKTWEIYYRPSPGSKRIFERVGSEEEGIIETDAEHALMERLVQIGRGEGNAFLGHPFGEVAQEWREQVEVLSNLSRRTLELYDNALHVHLLPAFADDYLHTIDAPTIERYITKKMTISPNQPGAVPVDGEGANNLGRPLGKRSIEQQLSVMNAIFRYAVRHKKMIRNPVAEVEISKKSNKKKIIPLEPEEVKELLMAAKNEEEETLFLLLSATGLRLGEALALRVDDFREKEQKLRIERTLTKIGGKTVVSPNTKTRSATRELKVSDHLAMRIKRQIARAEIICQNEQIKLLFPNTRGRIRSESNFRTRVFIPALKKANLSKNITPHTLRHTFASQCIAKSLPPTQIAYYLGHSNPQTTMTIYAHIFAKHRESIADLSSIYTVDGP